MDAVLPLILNNLGAIVAALMALAGLVLGPSTIRRRRVALAIYHAYHVVEDVDAELGPDNTTLDKPLAGLKAADEWLKANGWRALEPGEQDLAKLTFKSMNAQSDAKSALALISGSVSPP